MYKKRFLHKIALGIIQNEPELFLHTDGFKYCYITVTI